MATGPDLQKQFHALVLAAGSASRFGGRKLLADWHGAPLLHAALAAARAAPVDGVTVVTGADAADVGSAIDAFDPAMRQVHAPGYAEGMSASLKTGIAALSPDTDAVFVFLGDMPRVPHVVLGGLADAMRSGAAAAVPVFQGRRGNPVVLAREVFADIAKLSGDTGARQILQGPGSRVALVQSPDDGILFDVDTPGDLSG